MSFASYCMLFGIFVFFLETKTATSQFVLKPSNPSYAVEGQDFTLEWTYTLGGSLFTVQFSNVTGGGDDVIGLRVGPGKINSTQKYEARFRAQATSTRAELMILAVQLSDEAVYKLFLSSSKPAFFTHSVKVIVLSPPSNIMTSSDHTITAPTELTLNCSADGKPKPTITWTRVSDNTVVFMPLNISGEKNDESYRCTADNGVGKSLTKVVNVTLMSPPSNIITSSDQTITAPAELTLNCLADGKPEPTITWRRVSDNTVVYMPLKIAGGKTEESYRCTADNCVGTPLTKVVNVTILYAVEATGRGENAAVAGGGAKTFSCPVDGNPEPNIEWYIEKTGRKISCERQVEVKESGCYTCVASNSIGTAINITQCLIVVYERSTTVTSSTVSGGEQIQAILTIITNYEQAFKDLNSASSKEFIAKFVEEMDKVYRNMSEYIKTEVTQMRSGSVIVYFILYFKTALTPEKGLENLRVAISSTGTFGGFQAKELVLFSEESTKSTITTEIKCTRSDNETALLIVIGVLVTIISLLIAIIIWQQRKLRSIGSKRPYNHPEERDAGFYDNDIAMKDVNPTHHRPKNSTQQQIPPELSYMPLRGLAPTGEGPITPESPTPNVEYAPLDMRTRSWEVARDDVKVEKIIGKGAFGQVAKGTAKNLRFKSGATSVAIKMVKANAPESDKRDLKSELELMKRFKPHPHVIKLLGCVTESEPLLVLIEYVPYGDLLGYLRKSRGLNDTYYKDPNIKLQTSLTSQQLMKFAWQIADGMSYLSLKKVIHRDLAARNVLVGERETCKITDFGMARDVQEENIYERKTKGRLPVKWTAYESLLYGQYTTKSDVWSYGVVLYEISTIGGSPYPRMEGRKIVSLLQQGYRMPKPEHVDSDLYEIMMNCWQSEPEARPSFNDLTQQLKRMENQHKKLIKMHIYDNTLYANLEDLNA